MPDESFSVKDDGAPRSIQCFSSHNKDRLKIMRELHFCEPCGAMSWAIAAMNAAIGEHSDGGVFMGDSSLDSLLYALLSVLFFRSINHNKTSILLVPDEHAMFKAKTMIHQMFDGVPEHLWLAYRSGAGQRVLFRRLVTSIADLHTHIPRRKHGIVIITTMHDLVLDAKQYAPFRFKHGRIEPLPDRLDDCNPTAHLFDGKLNIDTICVVPSLEEDATMFCGGHDVQSAVQAPNIYMIALTMLWLVGKPLSKSTPSCIVALPTPCLTNDVLTLFSFLRVHCDVAKALGVTDKGLKMDGLYSRLIEEYGMEDVISAIIKCPSVGAFRFGGTTGRIQNPLPMPADFGTV